MYIHIKICTYFQPEPLSIYVRRSHVHACQYSPRFQIPVTMINLIFETTSTINSAIQDSRYHPTSVYNINLFIYFLISSCLTLFPKLILLCEVAIFVTDHILLIVPINGVHHSNFKKAIF